MPPAVAVADSIFLRSSPEKSAPFFDGLPDSAVRLALWPPAALALLKPRKRKLHPSTFAAISEYAKHDEAALASSSLFRRLLPSSIPGLIPLLAGGDLHLRIPSQATF